MLARRLRRVLPSVQCRACSAAGAQGFTLPNFTLRDEPLLLGEPVLRSVSVEVPAPHVRDPGVQRVIEHVVRVMRGQRHVGLTAVQLGAPVSIMAMERTDATWCPEPAVPAFPLAVMLNPRLEVLGEGDMDCEYEWCPSVRDLMAILLRHAHVRIHCLDEQGQARQHELRGWPARIAQRLMDSLRGVYLTDYGAVRTYTSVENYVKGVCTPMPVVRAMMQQAAQGREFPSARVERLLPQR